MGKFELYIPDKLSFQDYIAVVQTARAWADGYDLKDYDHLLATLAPEVIVDYTIIVPSWGRKSLATQHLLGQPYFKSVQENEIIVKWQQLASHGRRENSVRDSSNKIGETSDGRSWMEHGFIKVDGQWKIARITPSLSYQTGDFQRVRRLEGAP
ncbi:hypothetical protein N7520_002071 [Penicillium odoratum]|uniref:uncharacterized protein n=1 Tax=Penicillium odoratum TaxID=1167516 RepID=UPI0025469229|nr:uncharacterized protein N7520_002071 [Penicillium odoratum]KAJ5771542.1 hypothetical protein N7520_002071 [Penicillium odoratum]